MHALSEVPTDWPSAIAVRPFDDANADLVRHAAPADWPTPVAKPRYHLVVIGGGTAGLVCAAATAGLGATVALVERGLMGVIAAGLAGVRPSACIAATALGIIPGTLVYTYFADALLAGVGGARRTALLRLVVASVLLIGLSFAPALARQWSHRTRTETPSGN